MVVVLSVGHTRGLAESGCFQIWNGTKTGQKYLGYTQKLVWVKLLEYIQNTREVYIMWKLYYECPVESGNTCDYKALHCTIVSTDAGVGLYLRFPVTNMTGPAGQCLMLLTCHWEMVFTCSRWERTKKLWRHLYEKSIYKRQSKSPSREPWNTLQNVGC